MDPFGYFRRFILISEEISILEGMCSSIQAVTFRIRAGYTSEMMC